MPVGDVRAMSPEETSKWCSSLALCGVRGVVLRELQDQILRQRIDGITFDKMLRSNTLMELGVEELNPRLALAIRRSWTTDFAAVNFVEYHQGSSQAPAPRGGGQSQMGPDDGDMPMPMEQRSRRPDNAMDQGRPPLDLFNSQQARPEPEPRQKGRQRMQQEPPEMPMQQEPPQRVSESSMRAEREMQGQAMRDAMQQSPAPRDMPLQGFNSRFSSGSGPGAASSPPIGHRGWGMPGPPPSEFAGPGHGMTAGSSYGNDRHSDPRGGGPQDSMSGGQDLFGARGGSRGGSRSGEEMPPHMGHSRGGSRGGQEIPPHMGWGGGAPAAPNGYPRSHGDWGGPREAWSHGGGDYRHEHDTGYPDRGDYRHDDGGYPDNRMGPPMAPSSPNQHMPHGMMGRPGMHGGHDQPHHMSSPQMRHTMQARGGSMSNPGLGMPGGMSGGWDGEPPPSLGYSASESPMQDPRMRQQPPGRASSGGWEGSSLEEAFVSRRGPTARSYPSEATYESVRSPARGSMPTMDQWGGGLDSVLPARGKMPVNMAQRYAEEAREAEAREAAEEERARASRATLEAAEASSWSVQVPQPKSNAQAQRMRNARAHEAQREADAEWGGMSLGDTLGSKRHERGGGGGDEPERGRGGGGMRFSAQEDIDVQMPMRQDTRAPQGGGFEIEEDYVVHAPPNRRSQQEQPIRANPRSPGGQRIEIDARDERPAARPPRKAAAAPADNGWGGQSLADAFAPKKAPPAPSGGGSSGSRGGGGGGGGNKSSTSGADCSKKPEEIIAWVRTLPESHVPEKSRENLAAIIEDGNLGGREFTAYVQRVPPEVCAPKHAMKLKAAWNNVLAEVAAAEVARENAANQPRQKATMIVV